MFLTIKGERHYLWRAVDQDGHVLDILVQRRRDKKVAKRFFRKLLRGLTNVPRVIITDKLKSYGAANTSITGGELPPANPPTGATHATCKSPGHAQRFLSASGPIAQHFRPRRHRLSAPASRQELRLRFQVWQEITTPALAA